MEQITERAAPRIALLRMTRIAVMTAALAVAAPWSVPIGPIPISLATLIVYLIGAVLGCADGTLAVLLYLLLGMIGLPVFTGFEGGVQKLIGVTGGYLVGYLPCAALVGLVADRAKAARWTVIPAMVAGTAVLYALGTAWFMFTTGRTLSESLALCVVPFLLGDAAKIAVAAAVGIPLRKSMEKLLTKTKTR